MSARVAAKAAAMILLFLMAVAVPFVLMLKSAPALFMH